VQAKCNYKETNTVTLMVLIQATHTKLFHKLTSRSVGYLMNQNKNGVTVQTLVFWGSIPPMYVG
jgi:hypothetical protein